MAFLSNYVSGTGTLTYVKDGKFTSLGHPILDEQGNLIEITGGSLLNCTITGVIKGERGRAGELKGVFLKNTAFATAEYNTKTGVTGTMKEAEVERLNLGKWKWAKRKSEAHGIYHGKRREPKEYSCPSSR